MLSCNPRSTEAVSRTTCTHFKCILISHASVVMVLVDRPGQLQSRASAEESLVVVQLAEGSLPAQADAAASAAASAAPPPQPVDDTERLLSLQLALKCADIGHLGESLEVHNK